MICFLSCKEVGLFRALLWGETSGFRFAYAALAGGAKWHCVPTGGAKDAVRPCGAGNESLWAFLERPPWSKKYQDSASLTWLSLEARKTLCVREMALCAHRRRERRCASVKWYFVPTVRREMSPRWLS